MQLGQIRLPGFQRRPRLIQRGLGFLPEFQRFCELVIALLEERRGLVQPLRRAHQSDGAPAEFGGVGGAAVAGFGRLDLKRAILDREARPQQVAVALDLVEGHGQARFHLRQGEPARPGRDERQESETDQAANDETQRKIDDLLDHLFRPVKPLNGRMRPKTGACCHFCRRNAKRRALFRKDSRSRVR